jgi:hypothetical protein
MTDYRRRLTAHHEAGHAVAAHLLGRRLELISIKPGRRHLGFAANRAPPIHVAVEHVEGVPLTHQPEALRRAVETDVIVYLAGYLAEFLVEPQAPGQPIAPAEDIAAAREALSHLTPRDVELLQRHEDELARSDKSDDDLAHEIARLFADGKDESEALLCWLTVSARRLVVRNKRPIAALAERLLQDVVLPGEVAEQVIAGALGARRKETPMPTLKKAKPDPSGTFVALDTFSAIHEGAPVAVKAGRRLSGDHPLVEGYPHLFASSDLDDAQIAAARTEHLRQSGHFDTPEWSQPPAAKPRIPRERRWVVTMAAVLASGDELIVGQELDVDDERTVLARKTGLDLVRPVAEEE